MFAMHLLFAGVLYRSVYRAWFINIEDESLVSKVAKYQLIHMHSPSQWARFTWRRLVTDLLKCSAPIFLVECSLFFQITSPGPCVEYLI